MKVAIKNMIIKIGKWIKKNNLLLYAISFLIISIIAKLCEGNNYKWIIGLICIFITFVFLYMLDKEVKKMEKQMKMPKERFTLKDAYGNIYIKEERMKQAMILLSMLEDEYDDGK